MTLDLLTHLQQSNDDFIHPKGRVATESLLHELKPAKSEHILEIGFGTGATLVRLLARYPGVHLSGVDVNEAMVDKAEKRLRFCRLDGKVDLRHLDKATKLPFESNSFDKIYAESVLAIQEGDDLLTMMQEVARVIKPGGLFCFNELLWKADTSPEEVRQLNARVKQHFGMIQANEKFPDLEHWQNLMEQCGFEIMKSHPLNDMGSATVYPQRLGEVLSDLFTLGGKLRARMSARHRRERARYWHELNALNMADRLEPYLIVVRKK